MSDLKEIQKFSVENTRLIPRLSGVYLMKNAEDIILYIGKAVDLRSRVMSYFRKKNNHSPKNIVLVSKIREIEIIVTHNEVEALILENTLIKKHKPRYNISLKDGKTYPYIKLTIRDEFPGLVVTRTLKKDGSIYFGPYPNTGDARSLVRLIEEFYSLRKCSSKKLMRSSVKGCINYQIGFCSGVCNGSVSKEVYGERIKKVRKILKGSINDIVKLVEDKMKEAAENFEFEKAAFWRDRIKSLQILINKQKIVDLTGKNYDCIALVTLNEKAAITLLPVRDGKLSGIKTYIIDTIFELENIIEDFLSKYYSDESYVPPKIIVQKEIPDGELIGKYLSEKQGYPIEIKLAEGQEKDILRMAFKNSSILINSGKPDLEKLKELKKILGLRKIPYRIECYDISNISGTLATGSQVVFIDGKPAKKFYRKYRIKDVKGIDDFSMMEEMLTRRFRKIIDENDASPDLIMIDGGKGHLSVCVKTMKNLKLNLECCSIAKREEEIFRPGEEFPVIISRKNPVLKLLQFLRDEAHRFAVSYHRNLRSKKMTTSTLENIKGIGKKKVVALFEHFENIERIMAAEIEELKLVKGVSEKNARDIIAYFKEQLENNEEKAE